MWTINAIRFTVVIIFAILALWAIWLDYSLGQSIPDSYFQKLMIDLAPELAGIVITVISLDYLNELRAKKSQDKQKLVQLKREMGSRVNSVALRATEELRDRNWLIDGSLFRAVFMKANLTNADLKNAVLIKTEFQGANMDEADLRHIDLYGSDLFSASLCKADLREANLTNVNLREVDLRHANLTGAKCHNTDFRRANLFGVILKDVEFVESQFTGAILPNGDKCINEEQAQEVFNNIDH